MSITIRPARVEDARGVAAVQCASWRATYRGIVPQSHLDMMSADDTVDRWRACAAGERPGAQLVVADDDGMIVGFQSYGPARAPDFGFRGELYAAYFVPPAMGKGLGTEMIAHVFDGLAAEGLDDMIVWVMEANARGRRFYRDRLGATLVSGSRRHFEIEGVAIWELAYGIRPLPVRKE